MMATFRYIAFISENPEKITDFYNRFLGTKELGRSTHGDISITDGFYNLTFFKKRPDLHEPNPEVGLHHVGIQVDSIEDVKARYLKFNPDPGNPNGLFNWRTNALSGGVGVTF